MNTEIKNQWTTALRSGEYDQGHSALHRQDDTYCCLGVLCDLAVKAEIIPQPSVDYDGERFWYGNDSSYLPDKVCEWAGLTKNNPNINLSDDQDTTVRTLKTLADANDSGLGFDRIAQIIEDQL